MSFSKEIYTQATAQMQQRRIQAEKDCRLRREKIHNALPEVAQLERQISNVGLKVSRMVLGAGENASAMIERLKEQNLSIQRKIETLLLQNGYSADSLKVHYHCQVCEDTGFHGPYRCECYNQLLKQIALKKLNESSSMPQRGFDDFSLSYYPTEILSDTRGVSARFLMQNVFEQCQKYFAEGTLL